MEMPATKPSGKGGLPKWAIIAIVVVLGLGLLSTLVGGMAGWGIRRAMESKGVRMEQNGGNYTYTTDEGTVQVQQNADGSSTMLYEGNNGESGTFESNTGAVPSGFPSDFPVYSGSKVTASWSAQEGAKMGYSVTWATGDSTADVKAFFTRELAAKGWTVISSTSANDTDYIAFDRGTGEDRDGGAVTITRADEGTTTVSVVLGVSIGAAR